MQKDLLEKDLLEDELVTSEELRTIEKEIDSEVADAVEFALGAPEPEVNELTRYIWADE